MKPTPEPDPRETEISSRALEDELRAWRPSAPSPLLRERIRDAAARESQRSAGWSIGTGQVWGGITAAAAVTLAFLLASKPMRPRTVGPDVVAAADPVAAATATAAWALPEPEDETVWLDGEIQGIVELPDAPPMWRVRYETVRRTSWSEPDGTSRQRFVPEERLLFVPISYQ